MRNSRFFPAAILAVVLSAIAGGFFGSNALATQDDVLQQYRVLSAALAAIDREYVEEVPSERLVYGAIDGMLKTLDPHSSFFDPRAYAQMRERQEGKYYGLGIQIQVIDHDITVMSIFEGSPAFKKGLRRGDIIARIEGPIRRQDDHARRQGLDERAGGATAQGPEGHDGRHLDQAARLRPVDRHGSRARRSEHHHRPRRVHDRCADRLREARRVLRDVGSRGRRRARAAGVQGHEAAGLRSARQPRRRARSGDRASRIASCRVAT